MWWVDVFCSFGNGLAALVWLVCCGCGGTVELWNLACGSVEMGNLASGIVGLADWGIWLVVRCARVVGCCIIHLRWLSLKRFDVSFTCVDVEHVFFIDFGENNREKPMHSTSE